MIEWSCVDVVVCAEKDVVVGVDVESSFADEVVEVVYFFLEIVHVVWFTLCRLWRKKPPT